MEIIKLGEMIFNEDYGSSDVTTEEFDYAMTKWEKLKDALSEKQVNSQQTKTTIVRNGTNPELVEDKDGDNAIVNASLKKDKTADTRKGCGKIMVEGIDCTVKCGMNPEPIGFALCKECSQSTEKEKSK